MHDENTLNKYYNIGGFNKPKIIGYVMTMIRNLQPRTMEEWKIWYLTNIHNESYLHNLAIEMHSTIPHNLNISIDDCEKYIYNVMFRRTFEGFNKEKQALKILRNIIDPSIQESPKEWDTDFFIDFFLHDKNNNLIGIQLKPDTFYLGNYQNIVNINGKMKQFCDQFNAKTFVLKYNSKNKNNIEFINPEIIIEIKKLL